jgi:hypothetical protein
MATIHPIAGGLAPATKKELAAMADGTAPAGSASGARGGAAAGCAGVTTACCCCWAAAAGWWQWAEWRDDS